MQKPKAHQQKYFAISALIYGAFSWGLIWYPYRLLNTAGINGVSASLYSYLIALLIGAFLFYKRARFVRQLPASSVWLSVVAGWTNLSYVLAIIDGEVMRVMLLFYLSPLWTLLLARIWLKERWHLPQLLAIGLSLIGAWLMLADGQWVLPLPQSNADWLALSAGIGFSITNVMTRHATHLSVAAKSMLVWVGVFIMSIAYIVFQGDANWWQALPQLTDGTIDGLLLLIALMLVSATLLVQYGVTKIPAIQASVLFMTELIVAAVAAYFLALEVMTANELYGGLLIVAAGMLSVWQASDAN